MKTVGNGGHIQNTVTQTGGNAVTMPADLIFTSDSGGTTKIPWEIDSYDGTNGILWAWVQLATVSHSSNTVFYVFYDDASVNTQQNTSSFAPSAVWDSNYKAVYHLPDGSSLLTADSTSNAANAGISGSVSAVAGQIDGGASLPGSAFNYLAGPGNINPTNITISAWVKATSGTQGYIVNKNYDGSTVAYSLNVNTNDTCSGCTNGMAFFSGGWHQSGINTNITGNGAFNYVVGTYDGTTLKYYVNSGTVDSSQGISSSLPTSNASAMDIGRYANNTAYFNGIIDEVRISSIARPANWITTEYNNQSNPQSFLTAGSEVTNSAGILPRILKVIQAIYRASTY